MYDVKYARQPFEYARQPFKYAWIFGCQNCMNFDVILKAFYAFYSVYI